MNSSPNFFTTRPDTDSSALEHLAATVNRLVRAETRQALTHYAFAGLFWGIAAGCVAVLVIRLWPLPVSIAHATISCIVIGLVVGLIIGWVTRRSPMAVAILADIRLNLKQRLSSAWELYEHDKQSVTAAGISRQLLKSRTPIAERIFPLTRQSGNTEYAHPGIRWGRLLPAVALLLFLLNTLDFERLAGQHIGQVDSAVQREGTTLRTYGASLAQRARDDNLEASGQMAESMRQLGRRMESGALARGPALERLNELRRDINNVRQRLTPRNSNADGGNDYSDARRIIENAASELADGNSSPSELRDNTSLERALVTADINQEAFRQAVEDAQNGDPESLEKMLQVLRENDPAERNRADDAEELERAYERVQSIRENLGAETESRSSAPSGSDRGSQTDDDFAALPGDRSNAPNFVFGDQGRPGGGRSAAEDSQAEGIAPDQDQPTVRPKAKINEGQELATQTRTAPKLGNINTPFRAINTQQQQQLEAI